MRSIAGALVLLTAIGCSASKDAPTTSDNPSRDADRKTERTALVAALRHYGIADARVLAAMQSVPRHRFVPPSEQSRAYANEALPIGYGQTISQPIVVAAMTQAAKPGPRDKCLEIGTGSGYQAAVLAELCEKVYSIEYIAPLAQFAERNLRRAGYDESQVALRTGDGYAGWPEEAPFDVVLVTAAPETVPRPLLDQLAPRGRLVIPVGSANTPQQLELWTRSSESKGGFTHRSLMTVRFVPFLGDSGVSPP